jgi:hypothetical protein
MQRCFPVRPGQLNTLLNKNVFSLDLKTATDELDQTVAGIKFHTVGAATRNARLLISVLQNERWSVSDVVLVVWLGIDCKCSLLVI